MNKGRASDDLIPLSLVFIFCWFLVAQPVSAQSPASSQRPIQIAGWSITGNLRLRFEEWDFFKAQPGDSTYGYGASLLRVAISKQFRSQDWLFEMAQPSLIGLPERAIAPVPQGQLGFGGTYFAANPDRSVGILLKQAFVRFKGLGGDPQSNLRIGRFEFGDGLEIVPEGPLGTLVRDRVANRLIGNFGFTHVGRSLDGIHFSRGATTANVTFMAARPTEGVFQVKGMRELDVDIVYGAFTKTTSSIGAGEGRIFATYYRDGRDVLKTDNRPLPVRSLDRHSIGITTVGGNYAGVFRAGIGNADVLFWGALQTGIWGTLHHRANAFASELGYQLVNTKLQPWLRIGYFRGSGDGDPSDEIHRTFFQELPTPRPFARFPLYNL
ncbi:MAG: alginate export family protein, partial [Acidobacteria bacterium]|nr:alginate export family protein [Acidobacteriota bacterium]